MATPVGHYLVGLTIAGMFARNDDERRRAPWVAAIACMPDLDLLPGLVVGNLSRFHHGLSHSLAAAVVVAVVATVVLARRVQAGAAHLFLLSFLLYGSHCLLDFLTLDTGEPIGVPLLWPWTGATFQSPILLLPNVQHTRAPVVSVHNLLLIVREGLVFVPLVGLMYSTKSAPGPSRKVEAWLYGGWFVVAAGLSILLLL